MTIDLMNAWGLLAKGGPMVWPIFFSSILAIAIGIEKFIFLNKLEQNMAKFRPLFFNAVKESRMKDALGLCEENAVGLGSICKAGLMKFGSSIDLIKAAMEEAAAFEIHGLKKRLNLLAFIVNAAPLLGLLGTVTALGVVFHAVQIRSNALNPLSLGDMSSGIWQALVTTCAGLSVGIISFAIYSFTVSRINEMVVNFDKTIHETITLLQALSELSPQETFEHEP